MVNIQICKSQYPVISLKLSSVIVKYWTFCRECIGLIFTNQNKNQVLYFIIAMKSQGIDESFKYKLTNC